MYSTVVFHLDHFFFTDPDEPGALPAPLRGVSSLTSPCLPPCVAREVLLLAAEARAAIPSAPSAAARRSLKATAFSLTLLAASPGDGLGEGAAIGSLPEALLTRAQLDTAAAAAISAIRAMHAPVGGSPHSGGNAEAQYHIGLDYFTGAAPACPGGRRLWKPALFWMLMSSKGGHAPALAWLRREGIVSD